MSRSDFVITNDLAHNKGNNWDEALVFGRKLRELRKMARLTQEEFAEEAGCSSDHITKMERGLRLPSPRLMQVILTVLDKRGVEKKTANQLENLWLIDKVNNSKVKTETPAYIPAPLPSEDIPPVASQPIPKLAPVIRELSEIKPHNRVLGREQHIEQALSFLKVNKGSLAVAITGLGGIGKSTVAYEIAERGLNLNLFMKVIWESAKSYTLDNDEIEEVEIPTPWSAFSGSSFSFEGLLNSLALHLNREDLLKGERCIEQKLSEISIELSKERYLIVLDNLETSHNPKMVLSYLQRMLRQGETCLLMTMREVPPYFEGFHLQLGTLDTHCSIALLKQEATLRNVNALLEDTPEVEEALQKIAGFGGGHPLTLKLIIRQLNLFSLDRIFQNLSTAYAEKARLQKNSKGGIYTYIFKDNWESLTPKSQRLLLAMKDRPGQFTEAQIMQFFYPESLGDPQLMAELDTILGELVKYSFLEIKGGLDKSYNLNSLTLHFLNTGLIEYWRNDKPHGEKVH